MRVDSLAKRVAWRDHSGARAFLRGEREPARGDRPGHVVGLHFRDIGSELLERLADISREARLDGGLQLRVALAQDFVHYGRLHARLLQLREGLSGIHRLQLLRIAHQHQLGNTELARDPEQVFRLDRGSERPLVDHHHRLRECGAHFPGALPREAPLGNARVPREKPLQRLALDPRLCREGLYRRRRGGETDHAPTLLLRERPGTVEHPRLPGSRVTLDADGAVLLGEDEPHRLF